MATPTIKPLLECQKCPALRAQFKRLRVQYPDYWNRPVPAHGPESSPLLIVGLAPGLKGANRTGVPFVGDASGAMLTKVLQRLNAVDQVRITNAVKCLPRNNKPSGLEVKRCRPYFEADLFESVECRSNQSLRASSRRDTSAEGRVKQPRHKVYFALGRVAHDEVVRAFGFKLSSLPFKHGARHRLTKDVWLYDSYHCSRYNVQTGRMTETMLHNVLERALKQADIS
jgi:uracil-DNA glycosylase